MIALTSGACLLEVHVHLMSISERPKGKVGIRVGGLAIFLMPSWDGWQQVNSLLGASKHVVRS